MWDIHVRYETWERLTQWVRDLAIFERSAVGLGWAAVGICVSAGLGFLLWRPAYDQLPAPAKLTNAYVTPVLLVTLIASGLVAGIAFWETHGRRQTIRYSSAQITREMDEIAVPFKRAREAADAKPRADEAAKGDQVSPRHGS